MTELEKILDECSVEMRAAGIPIAKVRDISYSERMKTSYGICKKRITRSMGREVGSPSFRIVISARLKGLEAGDGPRKVLKSAVMHELIHTCPDGWEHGNRFLYYAAIMNSRGYTIQVKGNLENVDGVAPAKIYRVRCTECGCEFARMTNSKLIKHPEMYRCRCGGRLQSA